MTLSNHPVSLLTSFLNPPFLGSSSCPRQGRRRSSITTSPDPLLPIHPFDPGRWSFLPSSLSHTPTGTTPLTSSLSPFPRGGGATTEQAAVRRGTPDSRGRSCTPRRGETPLPPLPHGLTPRLPDIPAKNLVGHRCCRSCSCWIRDLKSTPP